MPGILAAKALGLGPWSLGLVWRVAEGLLIPIGWYILLRVRFRPVHAAAAACILLADPGVLNGQLGYTLLKTFARPLPPENDPEQGANKLMPQLRILNPSVTWPWWLAFFIFTARSVASPSRSRVIAAGVTCGLLFHIYFFFWTTAVVGLLLAAILDRQRRSVYLRILAVGLLIGLPALIGSMQFRAEHGSDWLMRTDKFLPVGRFDELLIPRVSVLLLAVVWVWVWRRAWEWAWMACIATAGLCLLNHTAVTGLQIENFHWNLALGPALSFLLILTVADLFARLPSRIVRSSPIVAWVFAFIVMAGGVALTNRVVEKSTENPHVRPTVAAYQAQTADLTLPVGGAVAGDSDFQYLTAVGFDLRPLAGYTAVLSPISDSELDARVALNAYLLGWSRERFATDQESTMRVARWGPISRSVGARAVRLAARLAEWDAIVLDPTAALERFDVRVLARLVTDSEPAPPGWVLVQSGPRWLVWVRPR